MRAAIFVTIASLVVAASLSRASQVRLPKSLGASIAAESVTESFDESQTRIAFFERRQAANPDDADILDRLAGLYLQRLRETGSFSDLALALRASNRSLAAVPAERNVAGLTSRAMAEFASHEFGKTRDDARELIKLDGTGTPYALLGDAFLELGQYASASRAYARLQHLAGASDENVQIRYARVALLHGRNGDAKDAFERALRTELARTSPSRERAAWLAWQLGDASFFSGDYDDSRRRYDDALAAYPGYFRALASLGRLDAAERDFSGAIASYSAAIRTLPDPTFVAELGDVYALSGDSASAEREYDLVDFIAHVSRVNGVMYNRQLVSFDADHGREPARAYRLATAEYRTRRDILGADALAWAALKAGHLNEARSAMRAALRLGTRDPRLLYHSGMIESATGDRRAARIDLEDALHSSPEFDPLQAPIARAQLAKLTS